MVFGWVFAAHMVGAGVGASVAGWLRDGQGTYRSAWLVAAVLCGLAAVLAMSIPRATPSRADRTVSSLVRVSRLPSAGSTPSPSRNEPNAIWLTIGPLEVGAWHGWADHSPAPKVRVLPESDTVPEPVRQPSKAV